LQKEDKEQEINDETIPKEEKTKKLSKKKSLVSKKGFASSFRFCHYDCFYFH